MWKLLMNSGPFYEGEDGGGAGAPPVQTNPITQPVVDVPPPAPAAEPVVDAGEFVNPIDVGKVQADMAAHNLTQTIYALQSEIEALKGSRADAGQSTPAVTADTTADDLPPELRNDPAIKRLLSLERQIAATNAAISGLTTAQQRQEEMRRAAEQQANISRLRQIEENNVRGWTKGLVENTPLLKSNPFAAQLIQGDVEEWLAGSFNPTGDLKAQYGQLQLRLASRLNTLSQAFAATRTDPRAAAVERDNIAKNSASAGAGTGARPQSNLGSKHTVGSAAWFKEAFNDAASKMGGIS